MTVYITYKGPFSIRDRVMTPDGPGSVSALLPPGLDDGKPVQVTFDTADPDSIYVGGEFHGYDWKEGSQGRYADDQLTALVEGGDDQ